MVLLSRKFGILAGCAALVAALFASPAEVSAAAPRPKAAAHGHKPAGKRAVLAPKPKAERPRAEAKAAAKDAKTAAKDAKTAANPVKEKTEPVVPASSVGSPNEGRLVGGVKLDTSGGTVRVVPAYRRGDARWGLPALVRMIERASKKVAKKYPSAVLGVGDISHKNGGDIFLHRSHESGRDADLAFYVVDQRGKDLKPDTFVTFQGSIESSSMPGARFDVAKNWALVQAMLEDPVARVSHIFVADPLRRMLLAYAKPRVLPALYNRAAQVLMQPSSALPHDNHFHVRISCPPEMRRSCVEYPAGVFAKKGGKKPKGKPALVTPKGKPAADQAVAARRPAPPARPSRAPKPSAPRAQAKSPAPGPGGGPVERRLASAGAPKKKPIYLQSAAVNDESDPLDRVIFSVPALSHLTGDEPPGDDDGAEAKGAVDETGTVKITD